MIGVIDTSALIRLFIPDGEIPEGLEQLFRGVERGDNRAIAPEIILVESANVLERKINSGEITESESLELLSDILSMPIRCFPHAPLLPLAMDLAREHQLSVYDAVYLALALEQGAVLFTADRELLKIAMKIHVSGTKSA